VFSHESLAESLSQLRPGLFGGLALLLGWIGYLPAALMWALSFGVGTGINVGGSTVTALSPLEDRIEMVGLHLLPTTEQPWWLLAGLIPVAAGVVLTRLAGRARSRRDWVLMRLAALALVLICLDVWWVISVGRIGSGRLEVLGPPPIVIAVLTGAVAGGILLDLAGTWVWRRWGHRRIIDLTDRRRAAQQQQSSEADGEQTPTQADGEQHTEDTDAPGLAVHDEDPGSPPVGPADSST
jgi:hypothetical protein